MEKGNPHQQDETRWATLMQEAQAGNEEDYRQLLNELATFIKSYLVSRFGNHCFIEDWVQDILIAIHEARHTYDTGRRIRPWLFAIIHHKAIDALRRKKSYDRLLSAQQQEALAQVPAAPNCCPEEALARGELMDHLRPKHRDALVLTKIQGYSIRDAARQLGVSEGTVKIRVFRGIRELRKQLEFPS